MKVLMQEVVNKRTLVILKKGLAILLFSLFNIVSIYMVVSFTLNVYRRASIYPEEVYFTQPDGEILHFTELSCSSVIHRNFPMKPFPFIPRIDYHEEYVFYIILLLLQPFFCYILWKRKRLTCFYVVAIQLVFLYYKIGLPEGTLAWCMRG